jgi:allantoin racemase
MKILIINPNSDINMTASIQKKADHFKEKGDEVKCILTEGAPLFIENYEDMALASEGMIRAVKENEKFYDAFIVACHCDPNLDVLKEISDKPVVGIGEASMKIASMLGHKFSVLSTAAHSIPIKEELVRKYHLQGLLASIRAPKNDETSWNEEEKYFHMGKEAVEEDGAEVLVLGCAGLTGLDKTLEKKLNIPVLDGVICALIIARGLAKYGVSTSKRLRFKAAGKFRR